MAKYGNYALREILKQNNKFEKKFKKNLINDWCTEVYDRHISISTSVFRKRKIKFL